jgi:hypothetical protein
MNTSSSRGSTTSQSTRDVDRRPAGASELRVDPGLAMNSTSGGSRLRAPSSVTSARVDVAGVDQHPQRHAPRVAGRRRLRRVEVAVRVDPDDADPAVRAPARAPRRRASSSTRRGRAAASGSVAASSTCASSESSSIAAASGHGSVHARGLGHPSPPSPHARGTRTSPASNSRRTRGTGSRRRARRRVFALAVGAARGAARSRQAPARTASISRVTRMPVCS